MTTHTKPEKRPSVARVATSCAKGKQIPTERSRNRAKLCVNLEGTIVAKPSGNIYNIRAGLTNMRGFDWVLHWVDDDYDGAPDAGRQYLGEAKDFPALFEAIREAEEERAEQ